MEPIRVFLEMGKKRVFSGAVDWPGWCRSTKDEDTALQALLDYAQRYAQVLQPAGITFPLPKQVSNLVVVERQAGNGTTDFGAPAIILDADREAPYQAAELERLQRVLEACWQAFDRAIENATGKELRKGPRGGGREIKQILAHVSEADRAYLGEIAWSTKIETGTSPHKALEQVRQAIREALAAATRGELPTRRPRGGDVWPPRYFIRRSAWHVLDHVWEIEDRLV